MTTDNEILNEELDVLKSIFNSDELHVDGAVIKFISDITISDDPVVVKNADIFLCDAAYLPPVILTCTLTDDYPSTKPPRFTIECPWLTIEQLMKIALNLNLIHSQNADSPILYAWMSFIQNEIPATLGLNKSIDVSGLSNSKTELCSENFHLSNKFTGFEDLKRSISEYNTKRKREKFNESILECQICFLMFKGHDSILLDCSHAFCKVCFSTYLKNMIKDGRVIDIPCPQCDLILTPQQIHLNVDEKVFGDFERLAFNHALKTMADVVYCPIVECNSPVLVEKEDYLGICPKCRFSFCTLCKRSYHGRQNPCASINLKSLAKEYLEGSKEHQAFMLKKYGRSLLTLVDDVLALEEIENISKKCPRCGTAIEKNQGCNKMHCVSCNTNFCWLCLTILPNNNPYSHFNSPGSLCNMKLFDYSDSDE